MVSEEFTLQNSAKVRMAAGDPALGMIVRLARTADIAIIGKATGHDFLFLDGQHAIFSSETVIEVAQAAIGVGITPLIRARRLEDPDVPRLLDNGIMGVVFPDINTAAQARRAVEICKFAPYGRRSVAGGYGYFGFRPKPLADAMRILNDTTLVVCMVETLEGLSNLKEIAKVEGVDVIHIGCNDLLADMGKPGVFTDPDLVSAIRQLIAACRENGKWAGLGGDKDIKRQGQWIREGIRFVTTQTDAAFLMAEATTRVRELRGAVGAV